MSDAMASIVAVPISILAALVLVGIGLSVTRVQSPQTLRRHSGRDTYWNRSEEKIERPEGVLTAEYQPRRYRDDDDTIVLDTDGMEGWETTGRRAIDSPVRHAEVPHHWVPPIGEVRIAILETPTAEYLFARRPKDQLEPRMVRPYMLGTVTT